jgi:hypothetical protein
MRSAWAIADCQSPSSSVVIAASCWVAWPRHGVVAAAVVVHVDGHSDFFHPGNYDSTARLGSVAGMDSPSPRDEARNS